MTTQRTLDRRGAMIAATQRTIDAIQDEIREALITTIANTLEHCAHVTHITFEVSDQGDWLVLDTLTCPRHGDECPAVRAQDTHDLEDYASHIYGEQLTWAAEALDLKDTGDGLHWRIATTVLRALING
ncbi:hypothetical protein [Demequina lutea]|uniref:Uncharacterized protein n=1 Tax=Demequina lutea TaxID=431489 RepID=A0A7Z0CIS4_9MICO|nr:hypothetical protein [Demequina lutea]NYI42916.1 hypothetical protein [Demequina lutea]